MTREEIKMKGFEPDGKGGYHKPKKRFASHVDQPPQSPKVTLGKFSTLERKFDMLWASIGGPPLTAEHRFHSKRKWRFDRAHLPSKLAIEIHGGTHSGGRHTRGYGFQGDRQKINSAQAMGWKVFELTAQMICVTCLRSILALIPEVD